MARREWSEEEEETLLEHLKSLVDGGIWQNENGWFIPASFVVLETQMRASFPQGGITKFHIEAKMKYWKATCFQLQDMLQISGFGWNENENRLAVENEVWNEFVKVNRQLRNMRDMQFPMFNRWSHCFVRFRG
ncbi:uncharacterized protein LOC131323261 isoform X1 [Rhododendron vialii]|uniref:uncharacterized protein LOC131323261 isoform X1 n=1 Tax=Rhododendron vialii TaxID=182163 RepID=UPI00265E8322|nr:uncharacterized protein LOC131323261 isoform X1 [Rhododendron vialii]